MKPVEPGPFVAAYAVLVFGIPWLVFMSFNVRKLLYAQRSGIPFWSWGASERIRNLRQTDPYAAYLHQRCRRWFKIIFVTWLVGFVVLGLTLTLLHDWFRWTA